MKRSELNRCIAEADAFFAKHHFVLPPFAQWTPQEWDKQGPEADGIRHQRLGWDVTDFASGNFSQTGLTVFTLRNGLSPDGKPSKVYAEKIIYVREGQITPFHYHASKMEDIINRGGKGVGLAGRSTSQFDRRWRSCGDASLRFLRRSATPY